jgi:hypothetical protein
MAVHCAQASSVQAHPLDEKLRHRVLLRIVSTGRNLLKFAARPDCIARPASMREAKCPHPFAVPQIGQMFPGNLADGGFMVQVDAAERTIAVEIDCQ